MIEPNSKAAKCFYVAVIKYVDGSKRESGRFTSYMDAVSAAKYEITFNPYEINVGVEYFQVEKRYYAHEQEGGIF